MALMPELISNKTCIVGKSKYDGKPLFAFDNVTLAREFIATAKQPPQLNWYKQTIVEEEIQI